MGADTRIAFDVASANWQESDRLMAAVMTAAGSPTTPFAVDGYGTLDGVLLGDLASPRVEATFAGEDVRAWNVDWGRAAASSWSRTRISTSSAGTSAETTAPWR